MMVLLSASGVGAPARACGVDAIGSSGPDDDPAAVSVVFVDVTLGTVVSVVFVGVAVDAGVGVGG